MRYSINKKMKKYTTNIVSVAIMMIYSTYLRSAHIYVQRGLQHLNVALPPETTLGSVEDALRRRGVIEEWEYLVPPILDDQRDAPCAGQGIHYPC